MIDKAPAAACLFLAACGSGGSGAAADASGDAASDRTPNASAGGSGGTGGGASDAGDGAAGGHEAGPGACALEMLYGNGAAVVANNWSSAELAVTVDCPGASGAGRSIHWTLIEGSGGVARTASEPVANAVSSESDEHGVARVVYRHPSGFSQPSWSNVPGRLRAELDGTSVSFWVTAFNPGSQAPLLPYAQVLSPEGGGNYANLGSAPAGTILPAAIRVIVANATGVEQGKGVANIGIRPFGDVVPGVRCAGDGHTALTGADGIASCDLIMPDKPGKYVFDLDVGRVLAWKSMSITVTP